MSSKDNLLQCGTTACEVRCSISSETDRDTQSVNRSPNSAASAFGASVNGKYESKLTGPVRVTARQMNPRQLLNLCNTANEEFVPKEAMYLVALVSFKPSVTLGLRSMAKYGNTRTQNQC
jgi:hypothetical protein